MEHSNWQSCGGLADRSITRKVRADAIGYAFTSIRGLLPVSWQYRAYHGFFNLFLIKILKIYRIKKYLNVISQCDQTIDRHRVGPALTEDHPVAPHAMAGQSYRGNACGATGSYNAFIQILLNERRHLKIVVVVAAEQDLGGERMQSIRAICFAFFF